MPRRDGMPTNQEMVVDFTESARELYLRAYERQLEGYLPDWYVGKQLSAVRLTLAAAYIDPASDEAVARERLLVQPLHQKGVAERIYHDSPGVVEYYSTLAERMGTTALSNELRIQGAVPRGAVNADYAARYPDGHTRHIETFKRETSKPSIAAGKFFVEEAAAYVESDRFEEVYSGRETVDTWYDQEKVWDHDFTIELLPDLSLNGREPWDFLFAYRNKMYVEHAAHQAALVRMERGGYVQESMLQQTRDIAQKYARSLQNVNRILDQL